ncbi:MAG: cyclic nucleotide-binding domain-containing protein [Spirochaetia bacterium]
MKKEIDEKVRNRLKNIKLFEDFISDEETLNSIADLGYIRHVKKGEHIIEEGEVGDTLYILLEGSVRIQKTTLQNKPYTVVILKEDMDVYFGEVALIDSDKRSATVVAETGCTLFSVTRDSFLTFCEGNPYVGFKITMQIARKISASLRKMNQDVITLFEALVTEVEGENIGS